MGAMNSAWILLDEIAWKPVFLQDSEGRGVGGRQVGHCARKS